MVEYKTKVGYKLRGGQSIMQNMKYFMIFAFLLFVVIGYKTYEQYQRINETKKLIVLNESESLAHFISAFRQTYQSTFLRNHIEVDEKTINLLPVKTIAEISDRFSQSVQGDVVIRTVSDRPRNVANMGNDFELEMIDYFKKNPKETDKFIQKKDAFYYTKPLLIKQSCLKCHGKREDTIPSIRDKYKNAYDYKLGEVRGLLNIKIKEQGFFAMLYSDFIDTLIITVLLYIIFLIIIYKLIQKMRKKEEKYTKQLETDIATKTYELEKQKESFETLFEKSSDGILIIDDGKFVQCNEKIVEMLGYASKEDLLHEHPSDLSPEFQPDGRSSYEKAEEMMALALEKGGHRFEWVHRRADGEEFWSKIVLTPISLNNRKVIHVTWRDITNEYNAQEKIKEQHKYLQSIINGVEDPIMVIGEDYTVHLMNNAVRQNMDKCIIADMDHPKCYEISHYRSTPCDGSDHPCPLLEVMETNKAVTVVHDHGCVEKDKKYMELSGSPLFDKEEKCIGMIEVAHDITEHLMIQDELREQKTNLDHQAHHDTLTGLPNRLLFNDRLEHGIEVAKRHKAQLALFFIDLDHFKQINDSLGHQIGDRVLVAVTERLKAKIRKEDTLSRLGGDEFTIIMEDLKDIQDVSLLAHKVLKVLTQPIHIEGHTLYISCSIGISLYPQDDSDAHNLIKYADAAMYKAKEEGRNNFQFYAAEMTVLAYERVVMEANLRQALKNEEFIVYYQPQVDANTGKLTGMEALIRWQHPVMGLITPEKFIALAEETGFIVEIDRWVMKTAMDQISKWYEEGLAPGILALNLSMRELRNDNFIEILKECMRINHFKAEWLELEIAEGQVMKNPEESILKLEQISDMGIEIAIDDFGTGYSSLAYLKRLPVDKLKIDQSFVQGIPEGKEDVSIVKAIIALAKSLDLELIAEGVETKIQKEFFLANGCENIQGYYYGKPMPANEIKETCLENVNGCDILFDK